MSAVSWPWVSAWGSLEPSRRGGENAQKTGKNGGKMGEIRPKTCEGRELTKDQLAGRALPHDTGHAHLGPPVPLEQPAPAGGPSRHGGCHEWRWGWLARPDARWLADGFPVDQRQREAGHDGAGDRERKVNVQFYWLVASSAPASGACVSIRKLPATRSLLIL